MTVSEYQDNPKDTTTGRVTTVSLDDQQGLGIVVPPPLPKRLPPNARELTEMDPMASLPGTIRRSRASVRRKRKMKRLRNR
jgi:hypothetical protein